VAAGVVAAVPQTTQTFGGPDIRVNNAGMFCGGPLDRADARQA